MEDQYLQPLKKIKKVSAREDLIDGVIQKLNMQKETNIIPLRKLRIPAAAAIALLFVNTYYFTYQINNKKNTQVENADAVTLIDDFKIY